MTQTLDLRPASARSAATANPNTHAGKISRYARPLKVAIATPLGAGGRGGMDRLADLVINHIDTSAAHERIAVTRLTTKGGRGKSYGALVFASSLARFAALSNFRKFDLLHINLAAGGSFTRKSILATIARRAGIPYVVHIHTGRFAEFWNGASPARAARIDRLMQRSSGIIVLGDVFKTMVTQRLPGCAGKILVLPNATPPRPKTQRHCDAGQPVRITFLGVLCAAKGVPELIEALGKIGPGLNWTATLAGYGEIKETRARASELGIADRISTPGWLSPAGVDTLLANTDIFVLPSHSEGLPMSILEAFAAGIPVVATPVNTVADVVTDGVNGLHVPPGDTNRLAHALAKLIRDPDLRARLGDAGFDDHSRLYHPDSYVARLATFWQQASI